MSLLRHPSQHYIYYLLSRRTLDAAAIIQNLADLHLPTPQDAMKLKGFTDTLMTLREKMKIPAGFNPRAAKLNEETIEFLREWGIYGMWTGDRFTRTATDLLDEPQIRYMIEVMCLGPVSIPDIARRVQARFSLPPEVMNTRVITQYMHYYWNESLLDRNDWELVLRYQHRGKAEDHRLALAAPRTVAGAAMTVAVADRGGGHSINSVAMYSTIRDQGFRMFMQHAMSEAPTMNRTLGAAAALGIIVQSEEELSKHRGGTADLMQSLAKIETRYDEQRLLSVEDLPQLRSSNTIEAQGVDITEENKK